MSIRRRISIARRIRIWRRERATVRAMRQETDTLAALERVEATQPKWVPITGPVLKW
jgi:hypothetical protein